MTFENFLYRRVYREVERVQIGRVRRVTDCFKISTWVDAAVWGPFILVQNKGLMLNRAYLFLRSRDYISV